MSEKIIIESKVNKMLKMVLFILPIVSTIISMVGWLLLKGEFEKHPYTSLTGSGFFWLGLIAAILSVCLWIFFVCIYGSKITVTDKRVYGRSAFGKKVDLPMDSISAVATSALLNMICVATSAGKIKFYLVCNYLETHHEISLLISARQNENKSTTVINQTNAASGADELKKYKDLLDSGIITQEEFDAKKKQILGL